MNPPVRSVGRSIWVPTIGNTVEFQVPGQADMLWEIRDRVAAFARGLPFSEQEIDDIRLAVGEASANAVRHGGVPKSCQIAVKVAIHEDSLEIHIMDTGCGFDPNAVCPPNEFSEAGRGIFFMRVLMDEVTFHPGSCGTHVEMIKRLNGKHPPGCRISLRLSYICGLSVTS